MSQKIHVNGCGRKSRDRRYQRPLRSSPQLKLRIPEALGGELRVAMCIVTVWLFACIHLSIRLDHDEFKYDVQSYN